MSNKKSMLKTPNKMVTKALSKTKKAVKSANGYALNTTEEVVSETIIVAEQWQTVANKAIKESFKLANTQQDIFFDALTGMKKHALLSKKRLSNLFA